MEIYAKPPGGPAVRKISIFSQSSSVLFPVLLTTACSYKLSRRTLHPAGRREIHSPSLNGTYLLRGFLPLPPVVRSESSGRASIKGCMSPTTGVALRFASAFCFCLAIFTLSISESETRHYWKKGKHLQEITLELGCFTIYNRPQVI